MRLPRRELHRRLAALYAGRDAVLRARHLARADDPQAGEAFLVAIRDCIARHRCEDVEALATLCRELPPGRVDVHALEMLAAEADALTMRSERARTGFERALALADSAPRRLDAMLALAGVLNVLDRVDEEQRLLDQALPLAQAEASDAALARLYYLNGNLCFPRGEVAQARRFHELALRHARSAGAPALEARSLSGLGDAWYAEGRMSRAHAVFAECLEVCSRHGLAAIEAANLFMRGTTRLYLGRGAEALADCREAARLGRDVGNRRAEVVSRLTAGWLLVSMLRPGEARAELEEGLAIAASMGAARFDPFLSETLARVLWCEGQPLQAQQRIAQACETMERLSLQRFIGPWLLGTLALLCDDEGRRDAALARGRSLLASGCVAHNHYRFHVAAAEVALLRSDGAAAVREIEALEAFVAPDPCVWVERLAALVRACAAWLERRGDEQLAALRAARARLEAEGLAGVMPRLQGLVRGL